MFFDFRKAFLVYTFLKILLNQNINIINRPGVPLLSVELACNIGFVLYFILLKKSSYKAEPFPFKQAFIFVFISIFLSTLVSSAGISSITNSIATIINDYLFVYILWRVLRNERDIQFVLKGFSFVFFFLLFYGVFEKITGTNPIYDYQIALNQNAANVINWVSSERLEMSRVRSAIIHPIGFGILLAGFFNLYVFLITRYRYIWHPPRIITILFLTLSIVVIFFTNSRSPLIFLFIGFIPLLNPRKKSTYGILFTLLLLGIVGFNFIRPYIANFLSLLSPFFNNISTPDLGGSSLEMREMQFATAFEAVKNILLFGLGIESVNSIVIVKYPNLLGLESIWLWLLIERGIVGVISHIYLLISVFRSGKGTAKYFVYFFTIAWFVTTTVTSTPGVSISFFFTMIIIVLKMELLYRQSKNNIAYETA